VYKLLFDGASRGNPGPASCGFVVYKDDEKIECRGEFLGITTNNVAEYRGLIRGLEYLVRMGVKEVAIYADSQLVVKQIKGEYKVKSPHLRSLHNQVMNLLKKFDKVDIFYHPRSKNKEADKAANMALDRMLKSAGQSLAVTQPEE
jgi:ribonuclease HI